MLRTSRCCERLGGSLFYDLRSSPIIISTSQSQGNHRLHNQTTHPFPRHGRNGKSYDCTEDEITTTMRSCQPFKVSSNNPFILIFLTHKEEHYYFMKEHNNCDYYMFPLFCPENLKFWGEIFTTWDLWSVGETPHPFIMRVLKEHHTHAHTIFI